MEHNLMADFNKHSAAVLIFVSSGITRDGGGFYIGADGHIHHIGPWGPEVLGALRAAGGMLAASVEPGAERLGGEMRQLGARVLEPHLAAIRDAAAKAGR